jgi:hypothetical protein
MDDKNLLREFLSGGWIVSLVGTLGMTARILASGKKISIIEFFRNIAAASICSGISWFVLEQVEMASLTKAVVYGVVGVVSPELLTGIVKIAKGFAKNPHNYMPGNEKDQTKND